MDTPPIISIIIPVYNTCGYLDQCIGSLVNQTFKEIEIICVNDASTDKSLEVLREWEKKDSRIKVIDSPQNLRQGGARNLGLRASKGDYIGLIDSDDFISEDMYQQLIDNSKNGTVDIVIGNLYAYYWNDSKIRCVSNVRNGGELDLKGLKKEIILKGCRTVTNIMKRSLFFDNNLFYPEHLLYEDNAIDTGLFLKAKSINMVENTHPIYFYRQSNVSTIRSSDNYKMFDRLITSKMFLDNAKRLGVYEDYKYEIDFAFYKLYYQNTLQKIFSFSKFPREKVREIENGFSEVGINIKENPYYKGDPILVRAIKLAYKYPFIYKPICYSIPLAKKMKDLLR